MRYGDRRSPKKPPAKPPMAQPSVKMAMRTDAVKLLKPRIWSQRVKKSMACQGSEPTMPCTSKEMNMGMSSNTSARKHKLKKTMYSLQHGLDNFATGREVSPLGLRVIHMDWPEQAR